MLTPAEITNYVYLVYGDDPVYLAEAFYSIGTLLKQIDPADSRVVVFTDRPENFRALPVVCESIAGEVEQMKGPFNFGFRVKICTLIKCAQIFTGKMIFLDCDTFMRGGIPEMAAKIGAGRVLMYMEERLMKRFPKYMGFRMQLPDGSTYECSSKSRMFNSGVIGLRCADAGVLRTALAICDGFFQQGITYHISEQFALSEAFRIAGLQVLTTTRYVGHYFRGTPKKYMHAKIPEYAARLQQEPWQFEHPIPCSYLRVRLFKFKNKIFK